jgi:hypothetical protein
VNITFGRLFSVAELRWPQSTTAANPARFAQQQALRVWHKNSIQDSFISAARRSLTSDRAKEHIQRTPFTFMQIPFPARYVHMVLQLGELAKTSSEIIRSEGPPKHHYPSNGRATGLLCRKTVYFHPSFGKTVRHRTGKEGYKALYLTWPCCGYLNLRQGCAVLCAILTCDDEEFWRGWGREMVA